MRFGQLGQLIEQGLQYLMESGEAQLTLSAPAAGGRLRPRRAGEIGVLVPLRG